jgi:hypothetical protein
MNHQDEVKAPVVPVVGMGATLCYLSDRHACTVVWVSKTGKTIRIQEDTATRTDKNGVSESQDYTFTPNPNGAIHEARLTKRGWKVTKGTTLVSLGVRSEYYDFSF